MPNMPPNDPIIGALLNQPTDINFLITNRFRVILRRAPNMVYFVQSCNLPGFSMGNASQPTPFVNMPVPGDKIEYQDFWMMFSVDEEMKNYREIANWIVGLGFPRQFGQYAELNNSIDSIVADISLFILDSDHQPQHIVYFYNAFPVSLTDITFDTKAQDTVIPMVTATFKYSYWQLDDVNAGTTTMTPADRQ